MPTAWFNTLTIVLELLIAMSLSFGVPEVVLPLKPFITSGCGMPDLLTATAALLLSKNLCFLCSSRDFLALAY